LRLYLVVVFSSLAHSRCQSIRGKKSDSGLPEVENN
jgi:hypothetical protein